MCRTNKDPQLRHVVPALARFDRTNSPSARAFSPNRCISDKSRLLQPLRYSSSYLRSSIALWSVIASVSRPPSRVDHTTTLTGAWLSIDTDPVHDNDGNTVTRQQVAPAYPHARLFSSSRADTTCDSRTIPAVDQSLSSRMRTCQDVLEIWRVCQYIHDRNTS